jgi:hypothetical protein
MTGLLTVLAANFLYLAGLSSILDPMMSMEPFYIDKAQRAALSLLTDDPAWGPLYALWLKPFRAALGSPVAVYTANVYALSLGVSVLIYLYLLLVTGRAAAGVGAALFFLISDLNVPIASKVSEFALMVVLAGLAAAELVPVRAPRTSVAAAGAFLASYARPELYPAALCFCLAAFWFARKERGTLPWPAAVAASMALAAVFTGTPIFSPTHTNDRFFSAFREHFAWNWGRWHGGWEYFQSVWDREFGTAQTVVQATLTNPAAVARHLFDNLLGTLRFTAESAFAHYPLLVPATWPVLVKTENLLVSAAVFGALLLVAVRPRLRRQMFDRYGHVLLPYAAVAAFFVGSAIVIFPVTHYLLIPAVLLILVATLAATLFFPDRGWRPSGWIRIAAALACLAAVPRPFVLPTAYVVPDSPFKGRITVARTITDTIAFIHSLGLAPPVPVLTLTDGIGEMLGPGFTEVKVWSRGTRPLDAYVRDHDVQIIVSLEPGKHSFVVDDPYWKLLQDAPDTAGFTRLVVPEHETVAVYVRTDLLHGGRKP